ncbi:MAG: 4a-hydroxytetrahydrobiopterin dehydratase [Thermoanaerobaculia bacterium]
MPQKHQPHLKAERIQGILSNTQITKALKTVPGWKTKDRRKAISRTYKFPNFRAAMAFVNFVAELAEAQDHHPDIDIRYSTVVLVLTTHSEEGLTQKDFELASAIENL